MSLETTAITLPFATTFTSYEGNVVQSISDNVNLDKTSDITISSLTTTNVGWDVIFNGVFNKNIDFSLLTPTLTFNGTSVALPEGDFGNNSFSSTVDLTNTISDGVNTSILDIVETLEGGETTSDSITDTFNVSLYDLTVNVSDSGTSAALIGANVAIAGNYLTGDANTDPSGTVVFSNCMPDTFIMDVSQTGYTPESQSVLLESNTTVNVGLDFGLSVLSLDNFAVTRSSTAYLFTGTFSRIYTPSNITTKTINFSIDSNSYEFTLTSLQGEVSFNASVPFNSLSYTIPEGETTCTIDIVETINNNEFSTIQETATDDIAFYDVTFNVSDSTIAIEDAVVTFNSVQKNTNSSGQAVFTDEFPANNLQYLITKQDYTPLSGNIDLFDISANVVSDFTLEAVGTAVYDFYYGGSTLPIYFNAPATGTHLENYFLYTDITETWLTAQAAVPMNADDPEYIGVNFNITEGHPFLAARKSGVDPIGHFWNIKKDNHAWGNLNPSNPEEIALMNNSVTVTISSTLYKFYYLDPEWAEGFSDITVDNGYFSSAFAAPSIPPTGFPPSDFEISGPGGTGHDIYYGNSSKPIYTNGFPPSTGVHLTDYYLSNDVDEDFLTNEGASDIDPSDTTYVGLEFNITDGYPFVLTKNSSVDTFISMKKDDEIWISSQSLYTTEDYVITNKQSTATIFGEAYTLNYLWYRSPLTFSDVTVANGYYTSLTSSPTEAPAEGTWPASDFS